MGKYLLSVHLHNAALHDFGAKDWFGGKIESIEGKLTNCPCSVSIKSLVAVKDREKNTKTTKIA